jgi:hypothetical protein
LILRMAVHVRQRTAGPARCGRLSASTHCAQSRPYGCGGATARGGMGTEAQAKRNSWSPRTLLSH